ncbi:ParB/Srx family N-terminal domain-containing protein [Arthrobacter sp. RCC_34]|uniref:ParB/Srx family N-terminal domain-containing protein n=1 Tax=Arthrobacter sp. RCC_34 TaxID=3239230 RepID=UPI003524D4EF
MSTQTLITVDPSTLLVDLNIREAALDAAFVENIRANGVIQRPVVHKTDGGLRVVMGHRRPLAAVEVGHRRCMPSSPRLRRTPSA